MIKTLSIILLTILTTLGVQTAQNTETKLGSTLTAITGTTKVSDLDTILTTNLNALNTDKLEASSLYGSTTLPYITTLANLSTIGTITSGTWNGTVVGVAYGGTASTTICSNNVLLGNGSSGFKCANGHGTSGQFLTSNGAGVAPTWQSSSVNQTLDYSWTGEHSFTSASTTIGFINSLTVNKLFANASSTVTASSTVLSRDASGNVSWVASGMQEIASTTLSAGATSITLSGIPTRNLLQIHFEHGTFSPDADAMCLFNSDDAGNYQSTGAHIGSGAVTYIASTSANGVSLNDKGQTDGVQSYYVINVSNPLNRVKHFTVQGTRYKIDATYNANYGGSWENTTSQINSVTCRSTAASNFPAGSRITVYGSSR